MTSPSAEQMPQIGTDWKPKSVFEAEFSSLHKVCHLHHELRRNVMRKLRQFYWLVLACSPLMAAQTKPHPAAVARVVITANSYYGDPPALETDDIILAQDYKPLAISALVPLRGARADLELYVLVDGSSNFEFGDKFTELRRFLASQPPTTSIGVAYSRNGRLEIAQRPTSDRVRAIQALSLPSGGIPSNPFRPLAELIEGWGEDASRHAVIMISDGINPGATSGQPDASVEAAIQAAQRAGVTVYNIYHPRPDYSATDHMTAYSGQVQLAHLSIETGGQAYYQGIQPTSSFAPFLANISDRLANQYSLEFVIQPETRGSLQDVSVKCKTGDVYLSAPWKVWVSASPTLQSDASAKNAVAAGHKGREFGEVTTR